MRDLASAVATELDVIAEYSSLASGSSIALTVGSRGIANFSTVVRTVVGALKERGCRPFIVPSMGSHGGATADGQTALLASLGITEETTGAEIRSSMETVVVGSTASGLPVHVDRLAFESDGIILINRVKPHTIFPGPYQSGLLKMLLIGLGKHAGAAAWHAAATRMPFEELVRQAVAVALERIPLVGGLALVEDAEERIVEIRGLRPSEFLDREPGLLERATSLLPGLPETDIDLLIIDEMGKNISGTGMDTNVIRRKHWSDYGTGEHPEPNAPRRIFVRSLTPETHGNAAGIGLADVTLASVVASIDRHTTYTNAITATRPRGAMLPMAFESDEQACEAALASCGISDIRAARIAWITNTLRLSPMLASKALSAALPEEGNWARTDGDITVRFDSEGMLDPNRVTDAF